MSSFTAGVPKLGDAIGYIPVISWVPFFQWGNAIGLRGDAETVIFFGTCVPVGWWGSQGDAIGLRGDAKTKKLGTPALQGENLVVQELFPSKRRSN
jgi:hypothetical protein